MVKVNLTPFLKKKFSIQIILALEFLFMKNKWNFLLKFKTLKISSWNSILKKLYKVKVYIKTTIH